VKQNSVSTVRGSPPNGIYERHVPLPASAAWYVKCIILYLALKDELM